MGRPGSVRHSPCADSADHQEYQGLHDHHQTRLDGHEGISFNIAMLSYADITFALQAGPAAADVMRVLGRERTKERLRTAKRVYQEQAKL